MSLGHRDKGAGLIPKPHPVHCPCHVVLAMGARTPGEVPYSPLTDSATHISQMASVSIKHGEGEKPHPGVTTAQRVVCSLQHMKLACQQPHLYQPKGLELSCTCQCSAVGLWWLGSEAATRTERIGWAQEGTRLIVPRALSVKAATVPQVGNNSSQSIFQRQQRTKSVIEFAGPTLGSSRSHVSSIPGYLLFFRTTISAKTKTPIGYSQKHPFHL